MSEFVGRTGALRLYSYPERRGSAVLTGPFARNFAEGPATATDITIAGVVIPWLIGTDVPITPMATGIIRITGVVAIKSTSGIQESATIQVIVGGIPLLVPFLAAPTIEPDGLILVPIVTEVNLVTFGSLLPVGVTVNVQIVVFASSDGVLQLVTDTCSLDLQEVSTPTG